VIVVVVVEPAPVTVRLAVVDVLALKLFVPRKIAL
jgi:hypothetical protein